MRTVFSVLVFYVACLGYKNQLFAFDLHSNLEFAPDKNSLSEITKSDFTDLITTFKKHFSPFVEAQDDELIISADWDNDNVGAYGGKLDGWKIFVFGGLARQPSFTKDALSATLCHELGHLMGGPPYRWNDIAAEGQADWFSTRICLRSLWARSNNNPRSATTIDPDLPSSIIQMCERFSNQDALLCRRSIRAAKSTINTLAALDGKSVSFSTPDATVVSSTLTDYPSSQCRLDTMVAGALGKERPACWYVNP